MAYARDRLAARLPVRVTSSLCGVAPSGAAAWVFDQVEVGTGAASTGVRVTALLTRAGEAWLVAACYWSLPFETQDEQDAVKHAGRLEPGAVLTEGLAADAKPLAKALAAALAEPERIPDLYSEREDHASIGSVVDEVFTGPAGRAVWRKFVEFVSDFSLRGPLRGALVAEDAGWLAANIDIGRPPTPYRFLYLWLQEQDGWKIVSSHDAVSRPLPPH
jgi:hypothetical protein